jgi:hypothetical protein
VISVHLLSVSSRRVQPPYILSRNAAIDITSILQTAVLCDQRRRRSISLAILPRARGWRYCWNATRARAFQSPDSGSILKCTLQDNSISHASSMSLRHSVERGYCVFANLSWVDYSMAALTRSFLPPIGQITKGLVKGRSRWPIRVLQLL